MAEVRLIKIKEEILSDNRNLAGKVRQRMKETGTTLLNLMSSPGSGKTSLILNTISGLQERVSIAVVEADLDSTVDADKIAVTGTPAVQIETGGFCHVDAAMFERALQSVNTKDTDLVILENVGNLVCPAESDTGSHLNVVILSVPEGDDKPLKYPIIFKGVDAVVLNKIDYMEIAGFNRELFWNHISVLNPAAERFEVSCTKGDGVEAWIEWVEGKLLK